MGDLREPIVGATEERPVLSSPSSSNPNPSSIAAARWERAEAATQKIIRQVQPTAVSEERRRKVIDYVQRLIKGRIGCEVFPFGSVPLKTYLPDGDIDMTAFGGASVEDALVNDVVSVLEAEDQNEAAEFVVMDVQLIRAEVKLVKCIIQNIVVDISFNQLGGLCTLCFLEQVDRLIGKHHMFKNSIILIKAWCYYESRILGAHHGLISTYALETLVLYIFHIFHSSLHGPLAVLYRFLDYFSKFDWDNYCISLTGPVRITSLPEIVAEKPEIGGHDLLLSNDFLRYCVDMFSVPSRGAEINSRTFPQKHLNIVDPLKESNNLGRSVSKGNFYRIRSAFTYGARKLGQILLQPDDNIAGELHKFFSNTLDRHGSGQRPDVQDPIPMVSQNGFVPAFFFSETDSCREEKGITELKSVNSVLINGACKLDPDGPSHNGGNYIEVSGMEMKNVTTVNGHQRGSPKVVSSTSLAEMNGSVSRTTTDMEYRFSGDAEDLATSTMQGLQISNDKPKAFPPNAEVTKSQRPIARYAPHLYFSGSITGNGQLECGTTDVKELEYSGSTADRVSPRLLPVQDERTCVFVGHGMEKNLSVGYHEVMNTMGSKDFSCSTTGFNPGYREKNSMGAACSPEFVKSLSDLSGDYDRHLNGLHYGRWCFENSSNVPAFPLPPALPSQFQCKNSWDMVQHSYQMNRNGFSNVNANSVMPRPAFYRMNTMVIPGATFGMEESPKPRGIGTYFPIVNRPPFEKPLAGRGRNQGPVRSPRNNGQPMSPLEANFVARSSGELSQAQFSDQVNGTSGSSDFHEAGSPGEKLPRDVNGLFLKSERGVEMGTVGCVPFGLPLSEHSRQPNPASRLTQTSTESVPTLTMQKQNPLMGINQDRVTAKSSYRLKDEDDFPPLSI